MSVMLAESYRRVFYDLRPGKQIERRILLDAFQDLINRGFALRDATYLGFGSIFFYDFAMFYRYLGFSRMISLEQDERIQKRIEYNKPFNNIEVVFKSAEEYIGSIDTDMSYVAWFDYDYTVSGSVLSDVVNASAVLSVGSILLVTVDAKPPKRQSTIEDFRAFVRSNARDFLTEKHTDKELMPGRLAEISRDVLGVAVTKGLISRPSVSFLPLFSFKYDDSRPMYTFGGMFVNKTLKSKLLAAATAPYFRTKLDDEIFNIEVPRLTRKERVALDQCCPDGEDPFDADFGISDEEKAEYRKIFRYFPSYIESL